MSKIVCLMLVLLIVGCGNDNNDNGNNIVVKDETPMVLIPAGEFQMGSNDGEDDEKPVHTVYLDAFYMDVYEVTNARCRKFMEANGYEFSDNYWNMQYRQPNHPVDEVSWFEAKAYAEWVGERLPTEAEWEKAARGGLVGKKYPWGDTEEPQFLSIRNGQTLIHDYANYNGTGGKDVWNSTSPVGSFVPNGYGLYDMAGNVTEWCADFYDRNYYSNSPKSNPKGPDSGSSGKVARGGNYFDGPDSLRVADRYSIFRPDCSGFRCVQDVPK